MELGLTVAVVGFVAVVWRWNFVNRRRLDDERSRDLADAVVGELFHWMGDAGVLVPLNRTYWSDAGLSNLEAVELVRWMIGRGYVTTGEWGLADVWLGTPPTKLALSSRSMQLAMQQSSQTTIFSDGPVNFGSGVQIVAGGDVTIAPETLMTLARAVRDDARLLTFLDRSHALEAADVLEAAAHGQVPTGSPKLDGTLRWLRERADEAMGNALGAALWAGTAAVLSTLSR